MQQSADDYRQELEALIRQAQTGEIEQTEFEKRAKELTLALLLLTFLGGSRLSLTQLNTNVEAQMALVQAEREAQMGTRNLANDIYGQRMFDPESDRAGGSTAIQRIVSRVDLWVGSILGIFALGQMHRPDDPLLRWQYGPTEHCDDCLRLHDQIHPASAWRAAGWQPRSRRLQCRGFQCQCEFFEDEGPEIGNF